MIFSDLGCLWFMVPFLVRVHSELPDTSAKTNARLLQRCWQCSQEGLLSRRRGFIIIAVLVFRYRRLLCS